MKTLSKLCFLICILNKTMFSPKPDQICKPPHPKPDQICLPSPHLFKITKLLIVKCLCFLAVVYIYRPARG